MKTQNHFYNSNQQGNKRQTEAAPCLFVCFLIFMNDVLTLGSLFTPRAQKCGKHIDKKSTLAISKPKLQY